MQRHLSLLATIILANKPTSASRVNSLSQIEAAEDFSDIVDYIRYKPVHDFTFDDPNFSEYNLKLSIFQRGLAIYMTRMIQSFATKFHKEYSDTAETQLGLLSDYIHSADQLLTLEISQMKSQVESEVVKAIEEVNDARVLAEVDTNYALEVANSRAHQIQQEYDTSFLDKKSKALEELEELTSRLKKFNIQSV